MLGITVASLLISVIGTGAWQIGVLVVLAMATATAVGGGELLVVESAVSAVLLVALDPGSADGFTVDRILEGAIGGAVALAVSSFLFPPDPALAPGRAAQTMFVELGHALERIAHALEARDPGSAERALVDARAIDDLIRSVAEEVTTGRDTARYTPPRRSSWKRPLRMTPNWVAIAIVSAPSAADIGFSGMPVGQRISEAQPVASTAGAKAIRTRRGER